MEKIESQSEENKQTSVCVTDLTHDEARKFFLENDVYFDLPLPSYINFANLLLEVSDFLKDAPLTDTSIKNANDYDVNHPLLINKDGKYAWRKYQLIHPALYVSLVHKITAPESWQTICDKFKEFSNCENIDCLSVPVQSQSKRTNNAEQVQTWRDNIEQQSITLSLKYKYIFKTDVANCYSSLYTHSISWALHTKQYAKEHRGTIHDDKIIIGNVIDMYMKSMNNGQTNGIPEGSVLLNFIAEMVLGYADLEINKEIKKEYEINDYQILRYRDDYRIFVNNPIDGRLIIKIISKVMQELGMKLNHDKTTESEEIITNSIKSDKLGWIMRKQHDEDLQKHLLIIHDHAKQFPNSGSLVRALNNYEENLKDPKNKIFNVLTLISIIVDIAYNSPRVYPNCAALLSILIDKISGDKVEKLINIKKKFIQAPYSGHMEIWIQRILYPLLKEQSNDIIYTEKLCKLVAKHETVIWNNNWILDPNLKKFICSNKIIDEEKLKGIRAIIEPDEYNFFVIYDS